MRQLGYIVDIETWGEGIVTANHELLFDLVDALVAEGASGIATGWGGTAGGPSAIFHVQLETSARDEASVLPDVVRTGVDMFLRACETAGLARAHRDIARVEAVPAIYARLEADRRSEDLFGVAEIAALLGVSRQRVYELRAKPQFPQPMTELAAGPVWARTEIDAFLAGWERRPGRPKRASA